jgi:hypothetical protein
VTALVCLLLASAPKIAAPGLTGIDIADAELQEYSGLLADKLAARGAIILTPEDIAASLGNLKPDCRANLPGCMAQLGHALQADGVVSGTVRRSGDQVQLDLQLLNKKKGLTPWFGTAPAGPPTLAALTTAANVFGDTLGLSRLKPHRASFWWVPAAIGAGFLAAGGLLAIPDVNDAKRLETDPSLSLADANVVYAHGRTFESAWIASVTAGAIALLVSVVWFLVTTP